MTNLLWGRGASSDDLRALDAKAFRTLSGNIPTHQVARSRLPIGLMDLLADATDIVASKSEAKRAIAGNAIAVNKEKIGDVEASLTVSDLLHDRYLMIENGKKNRYLIIVE